MEILNFIESITDSDEFWKINYYFRSIKKSPHGGVLNLNQPNICLNKYPTQTSRFIQNSLKHPSFMNNIIQLCIEQYNRYDISLNDIFHYCDVDYTWYSWYRLLEPKEEYTEKNKDYPLIWTIVENNLNVEQYFICEIEKFMYVLICNLIDDRAVVINSLNELKDKEKLPDYCNKYGLSKIENAEYLRQGLIIGNTHYLYNLFINRSIGGQSDDFPMLIKIVESLKDKDFFIRLDNNLAVDKDSYISTATTDFQLYRGMHLDFVNIDEIIGKETIVHGNPKNNNKLVIAINPEKDKESNCVYSLFIEELYNPMLLKEYEFVLVKFIHAIYYPKEKVFKHIDFSVNQYNREVYSKKHKDAKLITGTSILEYSDVHYKIWCINSNSIFPEVWSQLVSNTLDFEFRELFHDAFSLP